MVVTQRSHLQNARQRAHPCPWICLWPAFLRTAATPKSQIDVITPHGFPASNTAPSNSLHFQFLNLQIEKQQLEISLLELEAQAKAQSLMPTSSSKPSTIPSLDTVRAGVNTGIKSQGQFGHNTTIANPQEWPHLQVPFSLSWKKF